MGTVIPPSDASRLLGHFPFVTLFIIAIAAVMGAFLVTYPRDRIRSLLIIFIFIRVTFIPAALLIAVWFLIQLFSVGSVANVQTGGVAYMAHIGGMIFGAVFARLFVHSSAYHGAMIGGIT